MRKVIFLDVDGVLCVPHKLIARGEDIVGGLNTYLDDECCQELKRIVDETGAVIVVSSAWRIGWKKDDPTDEHDLMDILLAKFEELGIPAPVYKTDSIGHRWMDREFEILTWLKTHGRDVENWIAIDDESLNLGPHFFKTRNRVGLEKWIADRAITFLETPFKEIQLQHQAVNIPFHETGIMNAAWFNGVLRPFEKNSS